MPNPLILSGATAGERSLLPQGLRGTVSGSAGSSEFATHSTETALGEIPFSIRSLRNAGMVLIMAACVMALGAIVAGGIYTAPGPGVCSPPGGGQAIPCPATELTPNNLFVEIVLVVTSMGSFLLGIMLVTLAWLRMHPEPDS
jgi:hypothetical protein